MRQWPIISLVLLLSACTQSAQVFAPVNNAAITSTGPAPTYTLTLNIDLSVFVNAPNNIALGSRPFSALLFQNGTLVAAQYNTTNLSATGTASLPMDGVNSTTNCPTVGTPAALVAGTYDLYFAVGVNLETTSTVNPGNPPCGGNGWIQSSMNGANAGNLYGLKASVFVTANTTYNINHLNTVLFKKHTFNITAAASYYACYVADINTSQYSATMQPLAIYSINSGNGTITGTAPTINLLPVGTYRYFCSQGANTTHFQTGTDNGANGNLTVSGSGTTILATGDFTPL